MYWKSFLNWLKAKILSPSPTATNSLHQMAHQHHLAQRQNSRIHYSHLGAVGDLPRVYFQKDEMNVANISAGGLLIIDDHSQLGSNVGNTILLELHWPDLKAKIKSRVVGANLHRRHIQFIDQNSVAYQRIHKAVELALPGHKFYLSHTVNPNLQNHSASVDAVEIWLDSAGNSLCFYQSNEKDEIAKWSYNNESVFFYAQKWPYNKTKERNLTESEIGEALMIWANFKSPSPRIRYITEKLNYLTKRSDLKKTGST